MFQNTLRYPSHPSGHFPQVHEGMLYIRLNKNYVVRSKQFQELYKPGKLLVSPNIDIFMYHGIRPVLKYIL